MSAPVWGEVEGNGLVAGTTNGGDELLLYWLSDSLRLSVFRKDNGATHSPHRVLFCVLWVVDEVGIDLREALANLFKNYDRMK